MWFGHCVDLGDHDKEQWYNPSNDCVGNMGVAMYHFICFNIETICLKSEDHIRSKSAGAEDNCCLRYLFHKRLKTSKSYNPSQLLRSNHKAE